LGTEDEINALMLSDPAQMSLTHSQVSDARVKGDVEKNIERILQMGPQIVIHKTGSKGCRIYRQNSLPVDVPGYPVDITNILGAGDAFGAGFLYGLVKGWDLFKACRLGNACGAIVVTRHACSYSMPTLQEVMEFVSDRGGLE
jgi:5-dehydro-2-deoxygluconokinase